MDGRLGHEDSPLVCEAHRRFFYTQRQLGLLKRYIDDLNLKIALLRFQTRLGQEGRSSTASEPLKGDGRLLKYCPITE